MLKFLIILLGIYLFFRFFAKPIFSLIIRMVFKKTYSNISRQQDQQPYSQHKPEGEVTVHKVKKDTNQQGDFVDYEEVK
ncbi:MAG: hypothetical protein ACR2GN_02165 [Bacteroidia bacterium]